MAAWFSLAATVVLGVIGALVGVLVYRRDKRDQQRQAEQRTDALVQQYVQLLSSSNERVVSASLAILESVSGAEEQEALLYSAVESGHLASAARSLERLASRSDVDRLTAAQQGVARALTVVSIERPIGAGEQAIEQLRNAHQSWIIATGGEEGALIAVGCVASRLRVFRDLGAVGRVCAWRVDSTRGLSGTLLALCDLRSICRPQGTSPQALPDQEVPDEVVQLAGALLSHARADYEMTQSEALELYQLALRCGGSRSSTRVEYSSPLTSFPPNRDVLISAAADLLAGRLATDVLKPLRIHLVVDERPIDDELADAVSEIDALLGDNDD